VIGVGLPVSHAFENHARIASGALLGLDENMVDRLVGNPPAQAVAASGAADRAA
jgi:hypothetical protein